MKNRLNKFACMLFVLLVVALSSSVANAKTYVLLVGVSKFEDTANYKPIPGVKNDIVLWQRDILANYYGLRQPDVEIAVLEDKCATRKNVVACLKRYASDQRISSEDTLILVFSTHATELSDQDVSKLLGRQDTKGNRVYGALALYDTIATEPASHLLDFQLKNILTSCKTRRIAVIIDTCYASTVGDELRKGRSNTPSPWLDLADLSELPGEKGKVPEGPIVVAASGAQESVPLISVSLSENRRMQVSPCTLLLDASLKNFPSGPRFTEISKILTDGYNKHHIPATPSVRGPAKNPGALSQLFLWHSMVPIKDRGPGESLQGIYVLNDKKSASLPNVDEFVIPISSNLPKRKVAIIAAVNTWVPGAGLGPVVGAVYDALSMETLCTQSGYQVISMTPDSPEVLRPTKANIIRVLEEELAKGDVESLVFYASMHGVVAKDETRKDPSAKPESFLLPADALSTQPGLTGLSLRNIASIVRNRNHTVENLACIFDACAVGADQISKDISSELAQSGMKWVVLSAANEGEPTFDRPGQKDSPIKDEQVTHGLLTSGLIEATHVPVADKTVPESQRKDSVRLQDMYNHARGRAMQWLQASGNTTLKNLHGPSWATSAPAPLLEFKTSPTAYVESLIPAGWKRRQDQQIDPPIDASGRLWIYRDVRDDGTDARTGKSLPFDFSHWMLKNDRLGQPGGVPFDITQFMEMTVNAHTAGQPSNTWMELRGKWFVGSETTPWMGWGAVSQSGDRLWWARYEERNQGLFYDLQKRPARWFCFRGRSAIEGHKTRIQVKFGFLSRDGKNNRMKGGDSLASPILSPCFTLDDQWQTFYFPLEPETLDVLPGEENDLHSICSFAVIVERRVQDQQVQDKPFCVQLDDMYIDFNERLTPLVK